MKFETISTGIILENDEVPGELLQYSENYTHTGKHENISFTRDISKATVFQYPPNKILNRMNLISHQILIREIKIIQFLT